MLRSDALEVVSTIEMVTLDFEEIMRKPSIKRLEDGLKIIDELQSELKRLQSCFEELLFIKVGEFQC